MRLIIGFGIMIASMLACNGEVISEPLIPGRNITILDYPQDIRGSISFMDHANPDWNLIYKYDLKNRNFILVDRFEYEGAIKQTVIADDYTYLISVVPTKITYSISDKDHKKYYGGEEGNSILFRNIKTKENKKFDLPGEVNGNFLFSQGKIFVELKKYEYVYDDGRPSEKNEPGTYKITAPYSIILQIDAETGKQTQIAMPGMQNEYSEYSDPLTSGDAPGCVYFEYFDTKNDACIYKYNFVTGEYSKSAFPEPYLGPDGRFIYYDITKDPPQLLAISRDENKQSCFVPDGINFYEGTKEVLCSLKNSRTTDFVGGRLSPDRNYYSFFERTSNSQTIDVFDIKQRKMIKVFTEFGNENDQIYYVGWVAEH